MAEYIKKEDVIKLIREDKVEITPNLLTIAMFAAPNGYSAEDCYKAINDTCDRHIKEIRNLPAADVVERKKGKWIPVTEQMPFAESGDVSETVLVTDGECVALAEWFNFEECESYWSYTGIGDVTHWMPLPEQQKEET